MKTQIAKTFGQKKQCVPFEVNALRSVLLKPIGTAIGDSIVHIAHLSQIKKAFPQIKIGVLVTERCKAIYENSGVVDILLEDSALSYFAERGKWDLYLDFLPSFTSKSLILDKILNPTWTFNFGKRAKKHYNLDTIKNYDVSVCVPPLTHFKDYLNVSPLASYLDQNVVYTLPLRPKSQEKAQQCWQTAYSIKILLNPQGSTRSLPAQELDALLSQIESTHNVEFLLTHTADSEAYFAQLSPRENLKLAPKMGLFDYFALVNSADIVVAVDGGGVHIACAYGKPLLAFYANHQQNLHKWSPFPKENVETLTLIAENSTESNDATAGFDLTQGSQWLNKQIAKCQANLTA